MTPDHAELQCAAGLPTTSFDERLEAMSPDDQRVYRLILRWLVRHGTAPSSSAVTAAAGVKEHEVGSALRRLSSAELVALDASGAVAGVFPLSARPTRHRVILEDGHELHAMCAVDALGVSAMVDQPATILSSDPSSGRRISVKVSDGRAHAEPANTVVLLCSGGGDTLASACCSVIDFYASATAAQGALERSEITGVVLQLVDALDLAVELFARLPATGGDDA